MSDPPAGLSGFEHFWVSPSAVDSFDLCPRKWAWRAIDHVKREEDDDESRNLGRRTHDVLAKWLEFATPIDSDSEEGRVAMRGIFALPPPKVPGLEVERWFGIRVGDVWFRGIKDVQVLPAGDVPLVMDHKTTKDTRWAKTPEDLVDDVQACIYAVDAMVRAKSDTCRIRWVYYPTQRDAPAKPVDAVLTREDVLPTMARAVQTARRMKVIHDAGVPARDVPCDPSACKAFGGCDYQDLCGKFSPLERMIGMPQQTLDEFLGSLSSKKPAINPPPAASSVASTETAPPAAKRQALITPPAPDTPTEVVVPVAPKAALPTLPSPVPETKSRAKVKAPADEPGATIAAAPQALAALASVVPTTPAMRIAYAELLEDVGAAISRFGAKLKGAV